MFTCTKPHGVLGSVPGLEQSSPFFFCCQDFEEDLMAVAIKTRLLERSALVAELHPDETRRMQLEMEEQATRTVRQETKMRRQKWCQRKTER